MNKNFVLGLIVGASAVGLALGNKIRSVQDDCDHWFNMYWDLKSEKDYKEMCDLIWLAELKNKLAKDKSEKQGTN